MSLFTLIWVALRDFVKHINKLVSSNIKANTMDTKTILSDFVNSPFFDFAEYDIEFGKVANDFLIFLLLSKLEGTKEINIGIFTELLENKIYNEGASIVYDEYFSDDKELSLRYSDKSGFELLLCYYSDSKEKKMFDTYNLGKDEIEKLPKGLVEIMKSVKKKMQDCKISSYSLKRLWSTYIHDYSEVFQSLQTLYM